MPKVRYKGKFNIWIWINRTSKSSPVIFQVPTYRDDEQEISSESYT